MKPDLAAQVPGTNAPAVDNTVPSSVGTQQTDTNIGAASTPAGQAALATVDSVALNEKLRAEIEAKNVPFDFGGLRSSPCELLCTAVSSDCTLSFRICTPFKD